MWTPIYRLQLHRTIGGGNWGFPGLFRLSTFKPARLVPKPLGRWRSSDGPRNSVGLHQRRDRSFFTKWDLQYESDSDDMEPVGLSRKGAERLSRPTRQSTLYFQCAHYCDKLAASSNLRHRISLLSLIPHSSHWPPQCTSPRKLLWVRLGSPRTSSSWRTRAERMKFQILAVRKRVISTFGSNSVPATQTPLRPKVLSPTFPQRKRKARGKLPHHRRAFPSAFPTCTKAEATNHNLIAPTSRIAFFSLILYPLAQLPTFLTYRLFSTP